MSYEPRAELRRYSLMNATVRCQAGFVAALESFDRERYRNRLK